MAPLSHLLSSSSTAFLLHRAAHAPGAMQSGLQEKATFLQAFGKRGVRSAAIQLPAATELALLCCVLTVLWVHAAPGQAVRHAQPQQPYSALGADELERGTAS